MDFGLLPPEINSARIYSGPGAEPMLAAASAWHSLAEELRTTAVAYRTQIQALNSYWRGPTSTAMAAAAASITTWLDTTATQVEDTATRAQMAVAAYETAFTEVIPPQEIATNRARLRSLTASNALGQNSPAIAATNAEYLDMWAHNAATMSDYARASAAATQLTPFAPPPPNTSIAGLADQASAVARAENTTALPKHPIWWLLNQPIVGALMPSADAPVEMAGRFTALFGGLASVVAVAQTGLDQAAATPLALPTVASPAGYGVGLVSANMGHAASMGRLSVPPSWIAATPPTAPVASPLVSTPLAAPRALAAAGMPAVPVGRPGHTCTSCSSPQYGLRLTVMARPPDAGDPP
jgi:PPE-repeat protein